MSYQRQQTQAQINVSSANPVCPSQARAFRFLESVAQNRKTHENSVYRKVLSLRTERQRIRERRKKVKVAIKDKYMQLESLEQQIDNLDIEIARLERLKDDDPDSDTEMSIR